VLAGAAEVQLLLQPLRREGCFQGLRLQVAEPARPPISVTPQVVVYGPDGTVYPNPAAAEAAGVTNYSMTRPTFDRVNPLDPVAPGGFASPIDPGVIRPFQPGEGGFLGGTGLAGEATTGFPAQGQPQVPMGPNEVATTFSLQGNQMNPSRQFETPFQRPEQMGGAPLSPEQALIFARQAAQRPMQRFAAGGSVRPMQQGVGSLMNYIKRG